MMHAPDGAITSTDVYRLILESVPSQVAGQAGDHCTCLRFTVQIGAGPELAIPEMVVSESTVPGVANPIHGVIERTIQVRNVSSAGAE